MTTDEGTLFAADEGQTAQERLRVGVNVLLPAQVAKEVGVSPRTVERWITKVTNPLPALRVTEAQLREMGYQGNLPSSCGQYYLVRKAHLPLIPQVRRYPQHTHRKRGRRGTMTGAGNPERQ